MAELVDGLKQLVDPGAQLRTLATGFRFIEGPVWLESEQALVFSDIPGDSRWRWSEARGAEQIAAPTFKANGMCLDPAGDLVICEHVSSCVTRIRDGRREILADSYRGAYLNSPNDVVARADGSLYFTDPNIGRDQADVGLLRPPGLPFKGVFRIPPWASDELELVVPEDMFIRPNGLCFSPDGSLLYVNDSATGRIHSFAVAVDGSLGTPQLVAEGIGTGVPGSGNVDGMKCDERGNIWVTGPGGLWVVSADGDKLGTLSVPEVIGNFAFGGDGQRTVFIASSTTLRSVSTRVAGAARIP